MIFLMLQLSSMSYKTKFRNTIAILCLQVCMMTEELLIRSTHMTGSAAQKEELILHILLMPLGLIFNLMESG